MGSACSKSRTENTEKFVTITHNGYPDRFTNYWPVYLLFQPHRLTQGHLHMTLLTVVAITYLLVVALSSDRSLGRDWGRRPGRPRACWTDQLGHDTGLVPVNFWKQAVLRGHGGATQRPELATR